MAIRQVDSKALMKMNTIKTSNKLVGDIENNELYAGDDLLFDRQDALDEFQGQDLDLDLKTAQDQQVADKKPTNGFLSKIQ